KTIDASVSADAQVAGSFAYVLKAQILRKRGDATHAKNEFVRALEVEEQSKDLTAKFYAQATSELDAAVFTKDAAAPLRARAAVHSGDGECKALADAFFGRGKAFWLRGDAAHALEDVNHAIQLAPRRAPPYQLRAEISKQSNKVAQSEEDRKKYEELLKSGD